jgi:hypothetical protein
VRVVVAGVPVVVIAHQALQAERRAADLKAGAQAHAQRSDHRVGARVLDLQVQAAGAGFSETVLPDLRVSQTELRDDFQTAYLLEIGGLERGDHPLAGEITLGLPVDAAEIDAALREQ